MSQPVWRRLRKPLGRSVAHLTAASMVVSPIVTTAPAVAKTDTAKTATPIKHIVMIIGENHTFDNLYGTYIPKKGETVDNILSKKIVKVDGTPGANFATAAQMQATASTEYAIAPKSKTPYAILPPPGLSGTPAKASDTDPAPFATLAGVEAFEKAVGNDGIDRSDWLKMTTGASGLGSSGVDTRITNANNLPDGPFQFTGSTLPYDSYTGSPVHRFFQMWQETDCSLDHATAKNPSGCLNDLFPWVEVQTGTGGNGKAQASNFGTLTTGEGSVGMGFYNMAAGDVPYLKSLSDKYTTSDNFHQSIMGGTGANHIALGTGLAIYYTDGNGAVATPPSTQIENPNPQAGTTNWYTQDGYSGGSYVNCSDDSQPGVKPVAQYLKSLPGKHPKRCKDGAYYLVNNYSPGYLGDGTVNTGTYVIPPSNVPTIADRLNEKKVSWRYYGAGWDNYVKDPSSQLGGVYCDICNPFQYETKIMANAQQREEHIKDINDLDADLAMGNLPAVSIIKPDGVLDGHPASSKPSLFEAFTKHVIEKIKSNPEVWKHTAILVTFDEGGGSWDSGYIQPLDFFGDGTRIPAIMVSPYSTGGHINHTYGDHVSFLKFIEKNWGLKPVSSTGRDNLPNPVTSSSNLYAPTNSPAIGDLMDMFDFNKSSNGSGSDGSTTGGSPSKGGSGGSSSTGGSSSAGGSSSDTGLIQKLLGEIESALGNFWTSLSSLLFG
ncbi:alkaline phosphatase family protein [Acetobacter sacchari]|uniref:Alkaline phosphatase family protein n=1 Tax=Acetobacter sacchari TaxID=2661687 RepID=A0ABS3LVF8_9PROT|nr:alkaline phosphatase family protein [Acetobacter sacchari]MBO1359897.1 alkaline phosphatase family protein [Acetobacter sacchari]